MFKNLLNEKVYVITATICLILTGISFNAYAYPVSMPVSTDSSTYNNYYNLENAEVCFNTLIMGIKNSESNDFKNDAINYHNQVTIILKNIAKNSNYKIDNELSLFNEIFEEYISSNDKSHLDRLELSFNSMYNNLANHNNNLLIVLIILIIVTIVAIVLI